MKTSELTGAALDWAVAKCEGCSEKQLNKVDMWLHIRQQGAFRFSTQWAAGGPIIERERIGIWPSDSIEGMWAARPDYEVYPERLPPSYGPTPMIAAMRCYVASKLGDEVELPDTFI